MARSAQAIRRLARSSSAQQGSLSSCGRHLMPPHNRHLMTKRRALNTSTATLSSVGLRSASWVERSAPGCTSSSNSAAFVPTASSDSRTRSYHSSAVIRQAIANKDAAQAKPTEEQLNETEDTIPEWQNPLHHNNPDKTKQFPEDFEALGEEMEVIPLPPFETDPKKAVAPPHVEELAREIVTLNLLELSELTKKISAHFGFDDAMKAQSYAGNVGGVAAGEASAGGGEAEEVEEKTIFDLKLVGFDAKAKIKVIKEVRSIAGLGLKEAKEMVESAPKVIQKDLKQDKADELKAQLEAVGAQIEIV